MTQDDLIDAIQRARAASVREDKERLRRKIENEVAEFLQRGGKIHQVTPDDCKGIPCQF